MRIKFCKISIPGPGGCWDYTHSYKEVDKEFREMEVSSSWVKKHRRNACDTESHKITERFIQYVKKIQNKYVLMCLELLEPLPW